MDAKNMIVKVGTNNAIKVDAVSDALEGYQDFVNAEVSGINISSEVAEQPLTRSETFYGAENRALGAFKDGADLGIGIESGISDTPYGYSINFTAVVMYDGEGYHIGHSTGFPLPPKILNCIVEQKMDLDAAAYACGFVDVPNIGKVEGGFLGVLTKGRVSRQEYSKQALTMALISFENKEMFKL